MVNVRCSSLCFRNIIKFLICGQIGCQLLDLSEHDILLFVFCKGWGFLFCGLALFFFYKMISCSAELNGSILTLTYYCFRKDYIDLVNDTNYKIEVRDKKIIVTHFGKRVELKKYFSDYNCFRYYISYYVR